MKELIEMINNAENHDMALGMLQMFNAIYGTQYYLFGGRVVRFDDPCVGVDEKYASFYDFMCKL